MPHGMVCWSELNTRDPEKAKAFYGSTIGWTFEAMPMPDSTYWIIKAGDAMAGGIFPMTDPSFDGMPEHWFTYIEVDDVDARIAMVEAAGGRIVRPAWDIPNVGRVAVVADSGGAVMAWMKPAPR